MRTVVNQAYKNSIQQYVQQRNINSLLHLTRIENLEAILKDGIIPRAILQQRRTENVVNDSMRLDGHLDASCISITFPNYKMFYRLRREESTRDEDWVVIGILPEVLWEKDCAFCYSNAATNVIANNNLYYSQKYLDTLYLTEFIIGWIIRCFLLLKLLKSL